MIISHDVHCDGLHCRHMVGDKADTKAKYVSIVR